MAANDGRPKLTIRDVQTIFQYEYWKCNKNILCGGMKVTRAVPEKHTINFFGLIFLRLEAFILREYWASIFLYTVVLASCSRPLPSPELTRISMA